MFNNLIESSSHKREFKRRGSFLLFTAAAYALLLAIAGIASIYAYDAHLENESTETVTLITPADFPAPAAPQRNSPATSAPRSNNTHQTEYVRQVPMVTTSRPDFVPPAISTTPNKNPPVPDGGIVRLGSADSDPGLPGGGGQPGGNNTGGAPRVIVEVVTPPPVVPAPPRVIKVSTVLNSRALSLPKPAYPPMAKQVGVQGTVTVQVLIDETGRVVSANALSGHPLLTGAAQRVALQARFSPTLIDTQPVKVSGVITYNFVLQ
jgi:protein TonB